MSARRKKSAIRIRNSAPAGPGAERRTPLPTPSISACLIVRDEEANLARCLESVRSAVDEIVVLDTGSTDRTIAIAESFGARVFHYGWSEDFAAARNESLRHAHSAWILQIDADEELIAHRPDALRAYCARLGKAIIASLITVRSPADEQGMAETVGQQPRLFRNHQGLRFEGRIHEQLRTAEGGVPGTQHPAASTLYLHHRGYIDSGDLLRRKGERNRRLLAVSIAEEPHQPAHHFSLGRQLAWEGRFAEALPPLEQAITLWAAQGSPADGYVPSMFATAALAATKQESWQRVLAFYEEAPAHAVSSELVYVAGIAAWRTGDLVRAEQLLNRAWQDTSLAQGTGFDPSTAGWRPLSALAELYDSQGQTDKAQAARNRIQNSKFKIQNPSASASTAPNSKHQIPNSNPIPNSQFPIPTISACIIARDEETNLPRCIESLRTVVDEIIVVDTGSTDRTVQVAEQLGAKVFHFAWCDDFAAARNESLRHASGEWILWIDADDQLVESEPGALRHLVASVCHSERRAEPALARSEGNLPAGSGGAPNSKCQIPNSFFVEVQSLSSESGEVGAVTQQCRLFRNGLGLQFRGRIHEQLMVDTPAPPNSRPQIPTSVSIRHWGYVPSGDLLDRKCERNLRLLQLEIADRPDDPYPRYMIGKQYVWQHDYSAALAALQQAIDSWESSGRPAAAYVGPLFAVAACSALNLGQPEHVLELAAACPADALSSDLLYYDAIACQRLGRLEDALGMLQRAVDDPTVRNAAETDPATSGWRAWYLASQISHALGRGNEAYAAASKAVETMPAQPDVLLTFARMALRSGHTDDARGVAERVIAAAPTSESADSARQLLSEIGLPEPVAV